MDSRTSGKFQLCTSDSRNLSAVGISTGGEGGQRPIFVDIRPSPEAITGSDLSAFLSGTLTAQQEG